MLGYLAAVECDSRAQFASQAISTLVVSPFMFWLAFQKVPTAVRIGAVMVGVVSLLVDGVLFLQRVRS